MSCHDRSLTLRNDSPGLSTIAYRYRSPQTTESPRVLLVHALAMSSLQWLELIAELPVDWGLLVPDCRAHGLSAPVQGPYSFVVFANDMRDLIEEVGWSDCVAVGCSMGGCVVQALAITHPGVVSHAVLIDTTAHYGDHTLSKWEERSATAREKGMSALLPFQLDRWFTAEFLAERPDVVKRCEEIFLRTDPISYGHVCKMLAAVDLRCALNTVSCPTLIVVGGQDYATPLAMAKTMLQEIPNSELLVLPHARHFAPNECPADVAEAIKNILVGKD